VEDERDEVSGGDEASGVDSSWLRTALKTGGGWRRVGKRLCRAEIFFECDLAWPEILGGACRADFFQGRK
jgi:hypothetical protein